MAICECPITTIITSLGSQQCGFDFGQVSGVMFQKIGELWTDDSTPATDIQALAAWTTREAAVDDTKITVLQQISSFVIPTNESINIAADTNDTPQGAELSVDKTTQKATMILRNPPVALKAALETLSCSSKQSGQLGVVLMGSSSVVGSLATVDEFDGLPINNMFVSDIGIGGKVDTNDIAISWNMDQGWGDNMVEKAVDFNPLTFANS